MGASFRMGCNQSTNTPNVDEKITTGEDWKLIVYGLLKTFHNFANVFHRSNDGNLNVINSILKDYSSNWDNFYEKLSGYFDEFRESLKQEEEFKISVEDGRTADTYIIRLELKRPRGTPQENNHESQPDAPMEAQEQPGTVPVDSHLVELLTRFRASNFLNSQFYKGIFNYSQHPNLESLKAIDYLREFFDKTRRNNYEEIVQLRDFLISQLHLNSIQFSNCILFVKIFNLCLTCDLLRIQCDDTDPIKLELSFPEVEDVSSMQEFDDVLNTMRQSQEKVEDKEELVAVEEHEQLINLQNEFDQILAVTAKTSPCENLDFNAEILLPTHLPEETMSEAEKMAQDMFNAKLEEQKEKFKKELEERREERRRRRMEHDAEMKSLRQQQKACFATLMGCFTLKMRFEEKESEWSNWLENHVKKLIVRMVGQFGSFQDLTRNTHNFTKMMKECPEDIIYEIRNLESQVANLVYDLEDIFNDLAKVDQDYEIVMFVRVIQKRLCKISIDLIDLLHLLQEIEYSAGWYQNLEQEIHKISPQPVPTVTELKAICKVLNESDYENLIFPKWENRSYVKVEIVEAKEADEEIEDFPESLSDEESSHESVENGVHQSVQTSSGYDEDDSESQYPDDIRENSSQTLYYSVKTSANDFICKEGATALTTSRIAEATTASTNTVGTKVVNSTTSVTGYIEKDPIQQHTTSMIEISLERLKRNSDSIDSDDSDKHDQFDKKNRCLNDINEQVEKEKGYSELQNKYPTESTTKNNYESLHGELIVKPVGVFPYQQCIEPSCPPLNKNGTVHENLTFSATTSEDDDKYYQGSREPSISPNLEDLKSNPTDDSNFLPENAASSSAPVIDFGATEWKSNDITIRTRSQTDGISSTYDRSLNGKDTEGNKKRKRNTHNVAPYTVTKKNQQRSEQNRIDIEFTPKRHK